MALLLAVLQKITRRCNPTRTWYTRCWIYISTPEAEPISWIPARNVLWIAISYEETNQDVTKLAQSYWAMKRLQGWCRWRRWCWWACSRRILWRCIVTKVSILNHIDTCRRIWNGLVADSWHVGGERKGEGVEFACVEEGGGKLDVESLTLSIYLSPNNRVVMNKMETKNINMSIPEANQRTTNQP